MNITPTEFDGLFIIKPSVFEDSRGYFFESFHQKKFEDSTGIQCEFVQDNQSRSVYGVIRGLHLQVPPMAQAKLVRVLKGEVLDVVVDLRKDQPTFGKSFSIHLSAENKQQLFIPRGFAHGIAVLSKEAEFFYKCDNYYSPENERGIIYNDASLNIDWKIEPEKRIISNKDQKNLTFSSFDFLF
ncbi:dTDP-4-dehydrorhamnose 3,5-epimerase [Marivirga harenae]|uniref:dTDP-4-dehydrorhamnose 3,5-epimerase n=1 Tax=Marivirga harenae TaxID=2010992 RepID=UPI0026E0F68B|nr:dTDP-4-dehydrorhamnose 3,5-epimerase [Marivirga harenae]WKV13046.1 dTDP-4-dehydrorhamnose 3,5-epimerase [Marivirga harenae]|tara:strand:+ start:181004 stop:181555 length:552 start_codon:yes stop_codon:yes gene_type:complete